MKREHRYFLRLNQEAHNLIDRPQNKMQLRSTEIEKLPGKLQDFRETTILPIDSATLKYRDIWVEKKATNWFSLTLNSGPVIHSRF